MINENEKDVNNEEEVTPSPSPEDNQESVNDNPEDADASAGEPTTPEQGQEQQPAAPVAPTPQTHPDLFDEHGIPWKNRAVEAARKLQDTASIVKETVQEALQSQNKKEVYTKENIPALKRFAVDNPEQADWVDQQIEDIRSRETANLVEQKLTNHQQKITDAQTRQQAEAWITNDAVFKGCFVDSPTGKVWNQADPLAQHVMQILNSPDPLTGKLVKDRPDALFIAADMAYGRFARMNMNKSNGQVTQLRKDLRKSQQKTMVPGGGKAPVVAPTRSPVRKALDNFTKSSSKHDLQEATKQHLLGIGVIKEE